MELWMYGGCLTMEVREYKRLPKIDIKPIIYNFVLFTGLSLIIAHIIQSRSAWKKCKFRIFGVTDRIDSVDTEKSK